MPKTKKIYQLPLDLNNLSLKESVYRTRFRGFGEDLLMGLIYLYIKYENFHFPIDRNTLATDPRDMMWKILLSWKCDKNGTLKIHTPMKPTKYFNKIKYYIREFNKNINKEKKFIIIPLYLGVNTCEITKGHFNICFINMESMEMERFEPYGHGVSCDEHMKVDKLIEKTFRDKGIKIKFISPYQFIPEKSFQEYEETEGTKRREGDPGGFCGVWGIWYVNLRLKYPNINSEKLIKRALELIKGKKNFKNFIRNYSAFLVRIRNNMLDKSLSKYSDKSLTKKIDNILLERNKELLKNDKKRKQPNQMKLKTKKTKLTGGKKKSKKQKNLLIHDYNTTVNPFSKTSILNFIKNNSLKLSCDLLGSKTTDLLGSGVSNTVLLGCLDSPNCKEQIAIRIMPIKNIIRTKNHPIEVELTLYDKFNSLNRRNILPHVPIKFNSFECHYNELFRFLKNKNIRPSKHNKTLLTIRKKLRNSIIEGDIHKKIGLLILEYCEYGNLEDYILKNKNKLEYLRNIIFQILITLATSQYHIPGFKHNDIHDNNVLIGKYNFKNEEKYLYYLKEVRTGTKKQLDLYIHYRIFEIDYYIPYLGYCAKMFDFDLSSTNTLKNKKLENTLYYENGITCKINPVFDLHLVLNTSLTDFINKNNAPRKLIDFYESIIPYYYRGRSGNYLGFSRLTNFNQTWDFNDVNLIPDDIPSPSEVILFNDFFKDYKNMPKYGKVIMSYDTKIPSYESIKKRKDMF